MTLTSLALAVLFPCVSSTSSTVLISVLVVLREEGRREMVVGFVIIASCCVSITVSSIRISVLLTSKIAKAWNNVNCIFHILISISNYIASPFYLLLTNNTLQKAAKTVLYFTYIASYRVVAIAIHTSVSMLPEQISLQTLFADSWVHWVHSTLHLNHNNEWPHL